MSDVVERLRNWNRWMNDGKERMELLKSAADEIERLRAELGECHKLLREILASPLCSAEFCERAAAAAGGGE